MVHKKGLLKVLTTLSILIEAAVATNYFIKVDNEWETSSAFYPDHGYALVGHVIKTLSLFIADCMQACQAAMECFSFNYRSFFNGTFVCELNRSNKKQNPGSYVPKEGYQYFEPSEAKYCTQKECLEKEALPGGWYRFNNSLFKLVTENKTWTDARQQCQSLGGDLVSFSTQIENTFVLETLLSNWYTPLARYRMDGTDQNLSLFNGATVGNIDDTKAVYFDGVDDHATIPRVDISTTDFTVALWIKPIAPWGFVNTVIDDFKDGKIQFLIYFYYGTLVVNIHPVDERIQLSQRETVPLVQWTHLSVTWNRDQKTARLFIDAIERKSKTTSSQNIDLADNPYPHWDIGARYGANNKYFKGWMRDLIVIPRALSSVDIQKLKDGHFTAWIGLNDIATEGLFQWSDGSPLTFTKASYPADNTVAKNCVIMENTKEWLPTDCSGISSFICKKKIEG